MKNKRKRYSAKFKSEVALDAAIGRETLSELSKKYGLHPNQISSWKQTLLGGMEGVFASKDSSQQKDTSELIDSLYEQIGRKEAELNWLKKKLSDYPHLTEGK